MTQEDKELLLKDLCARLPYGVKLETLEGPQELNIKWLAINMCNITSPYLPYLFPMSSMTEEQKEEYHYIVNYISPDDTENWVEGEFIYVNQMEQLLHFYHINHLDYRGLIPMDLAIDATGLNIY